MAHDLNNSLAPLLMGVQLLKRRHDDETSRRTLEQMESSARRGAEMVRQVLSFARGRGTEFERLDPAPMLHEMSQLARETFPRDIRVETQVAGDLWWVKAHPTQLHQVLLNLCVNARDAMPEGGTLTLAADNVSLTAGEATAIPGARPGDFVSILISDSGTGIAPADRPRLFEPFFTTKPEGKGTGLGLSTVKRIVEGHGGFLRVDSVPGEGSTFEVCLPRALPEVGPAAAVPDSKEIQRGSGERILVLVETAALRELIGQALADHGYEAWLSPTPSEALKRLSEADSDSPAKLVVLDIDLPDLDALDLLAAMRRIHPELPGLLIGSTGPTTAPSLPPRTMLLPKPVDLTRLVRVIHQFLAAVTDGT
jgi:CheY-like chemotaxis protein